MIPLSEKKCNLCGNPDCPYPGNAEYSRALIEKWDGDPNKKECWEPIKEQTA